MSIRDSGPGIPSEHRQRIFEPLFTTKTGQTTSGLGLSSCVAILQKLEGGISVDSEPGRGATFTVDLPFRITAVKD